MLIIAKPLKPLDYDKITFNFRYCFLIITSCTSDDNLFLSAGTIRKHVENIYTKLQVHNKLEAI